MSVLVVGRDEDCEELPALLAPGGEGAVELVRVGTPEAALPLFEGVSPFDVVLLARPARGDGTLSFLRHLRDQGVVLPVVVVDRREDPAFLEALVDLAPTEYLLRDELNPTTLRMLFRHALRAAQLFESHRQAIQENAQLNAALAALSTGVIVSDPAQGDQPILLVNPAFERITGYSASEVIGRSWRLLYGPDADPETLGALDAAIREHRPVVRTLRHRRRDGTGFWGEVRLTPVLDGRGRVRQLVSLLRDVTPQRETETRLDQNERCVSRLLDRLDSPAAIFQGDVVVLANEAMARLLRQPGPEDLAGRRLEDLAEGLEGTATEAWRAHHEAAPPCGSTIQRRLELWAGRPFDLESSRVSHQGLTAVLDVLRPAPPPDPRGAPSSR